MLSFHFEAPTTERCGELIDKAFAVVSEERQSGRIGYYALPADSKATVKAVEEYMDANTLLQDDTVEDIVVIGIGGSSLGAKALDSFLGARVKTPRLLWFLENSDPIDIADTLSMMERETTIFILISKSGSTIETTSIFKTVIEHFELDLQGDDNERVICITDEGSSLGQFADANGLAQFNLPHNVGGRFSVLSAVGVVPLTLAGYDMNAVLDGASDLLESFFRRNEEHLLQKAAFLTQQAQARTMNVLFSYGNCLEDFTKWYVQLWGESLGKIDVNGERVGLTPIGQVGAVDQHSFLQLVIEGPLNKTVTFVNIADFGDDLTIPDVSLKHIEKTDFINGHTFGGLINAQCDATMQSVKQSGSPVDKISFSSIDEAEAGAFIIYFELLTSLVGAMLDVNTYDQPGVELGKQILYKKYEGA